MADYKTGDIVKVTTDDNVFEGILMPGDYTSTIVIKLESGYNIGIDKSRVKKTELVKKYEPIKKDKSKLRSNPNLPTVTIISTGGTISSKIDYRTGGVHADYTAEDFVEMCPEMAEIANLNAKKVLSVMSEDLTIEDIKNMAKFAIEELNKKEVDGIVVTMGTDTLNYASSLLSFFVKDLNKPFIITAAQRSIDRGSTDAFMNLICSVTAAAKFDGAVLATCLHGTSSDDYCILNRGSKVRKMHTSRRDAFRPMNELPLAKVYTTGKLEITNHEYKKRQDSKVILDATFEEKTSIIYVYPGMDPKVIDFYVDSGYKGIVLSATALGHVPTNNAKSIIPNIRRATDKGVIVVIASQTLYGRTHAYVYSNLRKLSVDNKCIFAEDIIPETAYMKLGWILGKTTKYEEVKELMYKNITGEINKRHHPESFLY